MGIWSLNFSRKITSDHYFSFIPTKILTKVLIKFDFEFLICLTTLATLNSLATRIVLNKILAQTNNALLSPPSLIKKVVFLIL